MMEQNNTKVGHVQEKTQQSAKSSKRVLLIFVCIFVSFSLIFGATLGIISGVKKANATVSFEGLSLDLPLTNFFVSYYKYYYMSSLSSSGVSGVYDAPYFWNSKSETDGKTYGELLSENLNKYLSNLLIANYLFDSVTSLSSSDKDRIKQAYTDLLTYRSDGSEDRFNEGCKALGFEFDTVKEATTLLYKATYVQDLIYGLDGSNIKNNGNLCEEYLNTYSHVKLLIIRTETDFLLDENGNRIIGEDGNDEIYELTTAEKEKRLALIDEIMGYIEAVETNGEIQMSPQMFDNYVKDHDSGDESKRVSGYYFNASSSYTKEFATVLPEIVKRSLEMKKGTYSSVECDIGVCFIYKYDPALGAYLDTSSGSCFTDFYSDASNYFFEKDLEGHYSRVVFSDNFNKVDPITIPYNSEYFPRF